MTIVNLQYKPDCLVLMLIFCQCTPHSLKIFQILWTFSSSSWHSVLASLSCMHRNDCSAGTWFPSTPAWSQWNGVMTKWSIKHGGINLVLAYWLLAPCLAPASLAKSLARQITFCHCTSCWRIDMKVNCSHRCSLGKPNNWHPSKQIHNMQSTPFFLVGQVLAQIQTGLKKHHPGVFCCNS